MTGKKRSFTPKRGRRSRHFSKPVRERRVLRTLARKGLAQLFPVRVNRWGTVRVITNWQLQEGDVLL